MKFSTARRKAEDIFELFNTSLGIDVQESEIFFVKIMRIGKRFKKMLELKVSFLPDHDLLKIIQKTIKDYQLKSTYYSINFYAQKFLLKIIELPSIPFKDVHLYLNQHPEIYMPFKVSRDTFIIEYFIQACSSGNWRILIFICKKNEINPQFTDPHFISKFSFLTFNEISTIFAVRKYHSTFSGWHLHSRADYLLVLDYDRGYINSANLYHYLSDDADAFKLLDPFITGLRPVLITGEKKIVFQNIPHLQEPSSMYISQDCREEFIPALYCSLVPFSNSADFESPVYLSTENRIHHQKKHNIIFKIILILYFLGLCLFLLSWSAKFILNEKLQYVKSNITKQKSLLESRNQIVSEQNRLKDIWTKYQIQLKQRDFTGFALYRLTKCVPSDLWLTRLEISSTMNNAYQIFLEGFSISESEIIKFLQNIETSSIFLRVSLGRMYLNKSVYRKNKLPDNLRHLVQFQIRIDA